LELMAGLRKRVEDVLKSVQCKVEVKYIDPKIFSDQARLCICYRNRILMT